MRASTICALLVSVQGSIEMDNEQTSLLQARKISRADPSAGVFVQAKTAASADTSANEGADCGNRRCDQHTATPTTKAACPTNYPTCRKFEFCVIASCADGSCDWKEAPNADTIPGAYAQYNYIHGNGASDRCTTDYEAPEEEDKAVEATPESEEPKPTPAPTPAPTPQAYVSPTQFGLGLMDFNCWKPCGSKAGKCSSCDTDGYEGYCCKNGSGKDDAECKKLWGQRQKQEWHHVCYGIKKAPEQETVEPTPTVPKSEEPQACQDDSEWSYDYYLDGPHGGKTYTCKDASDNYSFMCDDHLAPPGAIEACCESCRGNQAAEDK